MSETRWELERIEIYVATHLPLAALFGIEVAAAARRRASQAGWQDERRSSARLGAVSDPVCDGGHRDRRAGLGSMEPVASATSNARTLRPPPCLFAIRELGIDDLPACNLFFSRLDPQDVRLRFGSLRFSMSAFLPGFTGAPEGVAFAAWDAAGMILGIVTLASLSTAAAELAVIVRSDCKRRGIGRALLAHAIRWADGHGLSHILGYVLVENKAMLALARALGFQPVRWDSSFFEVRRLAGAAAV